MNIIKSIYLLFIHLQTWYISWNENNKITNLSHWPRYLWGSSTPFTFRRKTIDLPFQGLPPPVSPNLFEASLGAYSPERNLRKSSFWQKVCCKTRKKNILNLKQRLHTHRLHVLSIFTLHEWLMFFMVNVGKYTIVPWILWDMSHYCRWNHGPTRNYSLSKKASSSSHLFTPFLFKVYWLVI